MKKVLSTVAALGLVAGLASTAAAVEFKMSGKYLVEGAYLSNAEATGAVVQADENTSDAYWLHTFEIKPTMKVNDKISMSSTIRLADDTIWGSQTNGDTNAGGAVDNVATGDVYVQHLYMDYASPIGNTRFGRVPAGTYGTAFMDKDSRADRVAWWPNFLEKPWSMLFYIDKVKDNDVIAAADDQTANDSDTYVARLYYKNDTMDLGLHYGYSNDKTGSLALGDIDNDGVADTLTNLSNEKHQISAYGNFKIDNYFINAELTHFGGEVEVSTTETHDYDSWAGMLKAGGKFDALTPSLMYFYAQGQDFNELSNDPNYDLSAALMNTGTGDLFEPLYILTGRHTGMLNNDIVSALSIDGVAMSYSGVHAVVAAADYAVSKDLTLHGAIGWAKADEEIYTNQDDDYGWEYNVGAAYKLLDNLTYEAHFGYLDTGDYFNYGATTDTTENIYMMSHSLTMTF